MYVSRWVREWANVCGCWCVGLLVSCWGFTSRRFGRGCVGVGVHECVCGGEGVVYVVGVCMSVCVWRGTRLFVCCFAS